MTKVGLVDDVGRGAEFIGDFGQRHLTDTKPTQLIDVSGQWPYRPVYSGRGGVPQRRQDLEESHQLLSNNGIHNTPCALQDGLLSIVMTLNAGVDVATDNTRNIGVSDNIDGLHDPSDDRVVQKQTLAPFSRGHN